MTIGGEPATSDDGVGVRNPADLKTVVGGYLNASAAHPASAGRNWMCSSSIDTVAPADCLTHAGELDVVVAAGEESATVAPHLLVGSREGCKCGSLNVVDHMAYKGLHDVFTDQPLGVLA
jgi:acetyl-CoA acetyltransferase